MIFTYILISYFKTHLYIHNIFLIGYNTFTQQLIVLLEFLWIVLFQVFIHYTISKFYILYN
jgi:hypothetical protein